MNMFSQTVIKMELPKQAEKTLQVITLYQEALPLNTTIVLGAIGYDVTGGYAPYSFVWMKNETTFATGDIAVFSPEKGSTYALKVIDKNNCSVINAINIDASSKVRANITENEGQILITPTVVTNHINIGFTDNSTSEARVRVFDNKGIEHLNMMIEGNTVIPVDLPSGAFFIVIEKDQQFTTRKFVVR